MSRLADLGETIKNAKNVLGKKNSIAWKVFNQVNGKRTALEISQILKKKQSNITFKLAHLYSMGLLEENGSKGKGKAKATIYKKIPELKTLKPNTNIHNKKYTERKEKRKEQKNEVTVSSFSSYTKQIIELGKTIGIYQIKNKSKTIVDLAGFKNGIYLVSLIVDDEYIVKEKFVVIK